MKKNILLTIAYDGSQYSGWQRQPDARTVQGEVEKAISDVLGDAITINGSSRTDAGVHAFGQRASFMADTGVPTEKLGMILNNRFSQGRIGNEQLPGSIKIMEAVEKDPEFHARFDSVGKKYEYRLMINRDKDIFRRNYCYQLSEMPNVEKMRDGARRIVGTHDFVCFRSAGSQETETTVRTIFSLEVEQPRENEVIISVVGDGFLYNMVRIITGTLVEVGQGKMEPEEVDRIIESGDRSLAGHTAPPNGLYLVEVYYDKRDLR